jgi:hypothetical protein
LSEFFHPESLNQSGTICIKAIQNPFLGSGKKIDEEESTSLKLDAAK